MARGDQPGRHSNSASPKSRPEAATRSSALRDELAKIDNWNLEQIESALKRSRRNSAAKPVTSPIRRASPRADAPSARASTTCSKSWAKSASHALRPNERAIRHGLKSAGDCYDLSRIRTDLRGKTSLDWADLGVAYLSLAHYRIMTLGPAWRLFVLIVLSTHAPVGPDTPVTLVVRTS